MCSGITSGGGQWRMTFRDGKLVARPEESRGEGEGLSFIVRSTEKS